MVTPHDPPARMKFRTLCSAFALATPLSATIDIGDLRDDGEHLIYRNPITQPDAIFVLQPVRSNYSDEGFGL